MPAGIAVWGTRPVMPYKTSDLLGRVVPVQGIARLSLGDHAIGLGGAAQGCRAPVRRTFPPYPVGALRRFNSLDYAVNEEWWRCRELNPGHCGYEPHALTI